MRCRQLLPLKERAAQIVDARSRAEYCGEEKTTQRGGAIPGAIHLEWLELRDVEVSRKAVDELQAALPKCRIWNNAR